MTLSVKEVNISSVFDFAYPSPVQGIRLSVEE
jgi:hypothetical protein